MPITPDDLKRLADSFDWDGWRAKQLAAITPHYTAIVIEQAGREVDAHDLEAFDESDPFVTEWFTEYLGERITQIDDTTRERVQSVLADALEAGEAAELELSDRIQAAVEDAYVLSPARANTIARTETAIAYGHGAGLAYRQNGIEHVEISDGDGDDECAEADGQIWTVDEYLAEPIAHPNCVRSAAPVIDDGDATDETDDDEEE